MYLVGLDFCYWVVEQINSGWPTLIMPDILKVSNVTLIVKDGDITDAKKFLLKPH